MTRLSEEGAAEFKEAASYIYEDEKFVEMMTPELIEAFTAE